MASNIFHILRQAVFKKPPADAIPINELVMLTAGLWALNAFAIDMMLPALGTISTDLGVKHANDQQLMIVVYLIFNGLAQLVFGPLVDRFGRRNIMLWALSGYIIASILSLIAGNFTFMLFSRAIQGIATAATRVAAIAVIRDRCSGRRMAQVMSLIVTVFMAAPIIAPALGQLILFVAPWRWIFVALGVYGTVLGFWVLLRLAESLSPEKRIPFQPKRIITNYLEFFRHRISAGYTIANGFVFAGLFAYISASEQIFIDTFAIGNLFALAFAIVAFPLGLATVINARLVRRYGMRRIGHWALLIMVGTCAVHYLISLAGAETVTVFLIFTGTAFFAIGLIGPNFTAIAMEPMGHIAGSAGAANGFTNTTLAGVVGGLIARAYDGTAGPIILGFLALSVLSLIITWLTERGTLFEPATRSEDISP